MGRAWRPSLATGDPSRFIVTSSRAREATGTQELLVYESACKSEGPSRRGAIREDALVGRGLPADQGERGPSVLGECLMNRVHRPRAAPDPVRCGNMKNKAPMSSHGTIRDRLTRRSCSIHGPHPMDRINAG